MSVGRWLSQCLLVRYGLIIATLKVWGTLTVNIHILIKSNMVELKNGKTSLNGLIEIEKDKLIA